tara:strand:- start:4501 stop:5658 length:1158 start_codon:yes stop_codon:yes gene_type:complete
LTIADPIELSKVLIQRPSITPDDHGALDVLVNFLEPIGFACHRLTFSEEGTADVNNLYARYGSGGQNFCFAGHTDVVPPGDLSDWKSHPFNPEIRDGRIFGRGAADMKCAIAAFASAAASFIGQPDNDFHGSISLLITGDEEGPAINGTVKVLDWMRSKRELINACLVGEPTNPVKLGNMIKIGRRGSMNGQITVEGIQGHVAYPALSDNPVPRLIKFLNALDDQVFDKGTNHFPPTNLEITSVDVANPTTNLIPARAEARFNIRFNDQHTGEDISAFLETLRVKYIGTGSKLNISISGESFLTPPGTLTAIVADAVEKITGETPEFSTTGGTSDARFIKEHCPVIEFGMINETAHKVNENAKVEDVLKLTDIYEVILKSYFNRL